MTSITFETINNNYFCEATSAYYTVSSLFVTACVCARGVARVQWHKVHSPSAQVCMRRALGRGNACTRASSLSLSVSLICNFMYANRGIYRLSRSLLSTSRVSGYGLRRHTRLSQRQFIDIHAVRLFNAAADNRGGAYIYRLI